MNIYETLHWREKEVVDILVSNPDMHDQDIAAKMGLATHTEKIYCGRAMERYGARTRTGLVAARLNEIHAVDVEAAAKYRGLSS